MVTAPAPQNVCLVSETRRAPSQHCRDARVYGHTTTAMRDNEYPPRHRPERRSGCLAHAVIGVFGGRGGGRGQIPNPVYLPCCIECRRALLLVQVGLKIVLEQVRPLFGNYLELDWKK